MIASRKAVQALFYVCCYSGVRIREVGVELLQEPVRVVWYEFFVINDLFPILG
jgi:hypothetical protein